MAGSRSVRSARGVARTPSRASRPESSAPDPEPSVVRLPDDRVVHERTRLGILGALAVNATLTFADLKTMLEVTDGNLSVHARKLEDAGYLTCAKSFVGRVPRTEFRLTEVGRSALTDYLDQMERLIRTTRTASPEAAPRARRRSPADRGGSSPC